MNVIDDAELNVYESLLRNLKKICYHRSLNMLNNIEKIIQQQTELIQIEIIVKKIVDGQHMKNKRITQEEIDMSFGIERK